MKKLIALLLAAVMCLSLAACGKKTSDIVVDGQETSAVDFAAECLIKLRDSEDFIAREEAFEVNHGEASPMQVAYAIEVTQEDFGADAATVHFLLLKLACNGLTDDGNPYNELVACIDYDTAEVYTTFSFDESWINSSDTKEVALAGALNGIFCSSDYNGEAIFTETETRVEMSKGDISAINDKIAK